MNTTTIHQVIASAHLSARLFVEEYGVPIDSPYSDWDGEAWTETVQELQLSREDAELLWPVFQKELINKTLLLCVES
jgi:hypothetical protein